MKVALFVDGSNFFYAQKNDLKWWVDPARLRNYCEKWGSVVEAIYYGVYDPEDRGQRSFFKALSHMGYSLCSRELKTYDRDDGTTVKKANLDTEVVADMFCIADHYDIAVLVSGDIDFVGPLQRLRARGKAFRVISSSGMISREMRDIAGANMIDFQDIRRDVEKLVA